MKKAYVIVVSGRVQKVGFRYFTRKTANLYNICGFVRNEVNGSVYIFAEGEESNLDQFILACKKGPFWSKVTNCEITPSVLCSLNSFIIQ